MSPKRPTRPKTDAPDTTPVVRNTTPDIPAPPRRVPDSLIDPTLTHPAWQLPAPPVPRRQMIEIYELPADTHVRDSTAQRPIGSYFLAPGLVSRLPPPDVQSGIRSAGRHAYVDLVEGGTVLTGPDAQSGTRARLSNELLASGPLLERVQGTLMWRPVPAQNTPDADTSRLIITRHPLPDDGQSAVPPKRRRPDETPERWNSWGIDPQHATTGDIRVDGIQYKVIPRGDASDPIVYIKNPNHMIYDFDLLNRTLGSDLQQQPRGAIQVPPAHHWQIDPTLPFERPLTDYVRQYFPQLSATSLENVAFHQFVMANGSHTATGSGLTLLRQTFNDWKAGNVYPRPQLADPLLMLPILPTSGSGTTRLIELPTPSPGGPLQRLDFDPVLFHREWDFYTSTQSGVEIKRFMASLLTRNGYSVFDPSPSNSYPALVFKRSGHDYVFFISLHRIRGRNIKQALTSDQHSASLRLHVQVGAPAATAVIAAHAENKVVWLRGGTQIRAGADDTVLIVRDGQAQI
ncbi:MULTISPECIES: hypothetical protein [Pseudomonas]|uniref:Cyclic nucleotide-binding domain-containing protein n=1 Tax=Pseudomonas aphyarum TaxID=2942629 RepID=A0ABT5PW66_9PSED|nr:hypothetical protein [Pseudomonas aphyarum]MDD0971970.1 hypothetical protein [Pseudomonas aphyarum]MDD1128148.1 hypothetical protein [Pseudomonas aphyarum]